MNERQLVAALAGAAPEEAERVIAKLSPRETRWLFGAWGEWAHGGQVAPPGEWRTWVLMAGRGFGKTRAGAEWVMGLVRSSTAFGMSGRAVAGATDPHLSAPSPARGRGRQDPHPPPSAAPSPLQGEGKGHPHPPPSAAPSPACGRGVRIALVAASLDEGRRVMVEGPSGILAVARAGEVKEWSFARRRILFASGAEATLFSGAHPEGLRGPEHDFAWCDELAKWRHAGEAWDNLQLGLRRGGTPEHPGPRALVTTTPRRGEALKRLLGEEGVVRTGGGSAMNPHLPAGWVERQAARLGGGLMRRQELDGELLEDVSGALWPRELIEASRAFLPDRPSPSPSPAASGPLPLPLAGEGLFVRIVIGVDPPASAMGDACGIVVCGLGEDGIGYVLADASAGGLSPEGWARKAAGAAAAWGAQRIVAEANNGGDMIRSVLRAADPALPVKLVHARGSKVERAAAVAALFEGGLAKFAGAFPELEDELAGFSYDEPYQGPGRSASHRNGISLGSRSPDRADAMVWAMRELMGRAGGGPAVRRL